MNTTNNSVAVKKIELSQGKYAFVDADDYEELNKYKWHYALGYARRNIRTNGKRRIEFMHRVIAKTPQGKVTDHINGDPLDNRKSNLRNILRKDNAKNARKRTKAISKYKGVNFFKRKNDLIGKWSATIHSDKEIISLGYFTTEKEAALAYNEAALKYHGEYASLNEVELMNFYEYQIKASRTIPKEKWANTKLSNFSMGLSGEVGEVVDHLKKVIYHNHKLDKQEVIKELGDVLWYVAAISSTLKVDLNEVARLNIEKLENRYPDGFNSEDSINRKV